MKWCVLLFALCGLVHAQDANSRLKDLGWMSGCWEVNDNGVITTERWTRPTENLMIGSSQTIKNGKTVSFEFLRIAGSGQGLVYVAKPSNAQGETTFPLAKMSEKAVVFENLKHDFPQRIIYRSDKDDSLFARIEGPGKDGSVKGMDIPMKRVKCD